MTNDYVRVHDDEVSAWYARIDESSEIKRLRICPYFVICGRLLCKFSSPIATKATTLYCSVAIGIDPKKKYEKHELIAIEERKEDGQKL